MFSRRGLGNGLEIYNRSLSEGFLDLERFANAYKMNGWVWSSYHELFFF